MGAAPISLAGAEKERISTRSSRSKRCCSQTAFRYNPPAFPRSPASRTSRCAAATGPYMDEIFHRRPAVIRGRLIAAALMLLALGGCQALEKLAGKTHEEPLVPPPPERKLVADMQARA